MLDAIDYTAMLIKAKAAKAAKAKTTTKVKIPDIKIADFKRPQAAALPYSDRSKYLKSINAAELKQAAASVGMEIKFGLNAKAWLEKNPHIKAHLDQITALAAELTKSKAITDQAAETTDLPADAPS